MAARTQEIIQRGYTPEEGAVLNRFFTEKTERIVKKLAKKPRYVSPEALPGSVPSVDVLPNIFNSQIRLIFPEYQVVTTDKHGMFDPFFRIEAEGRTYVLPKKRLVSHDVHFARGARHGFVIVGEYGKEWSTALLNAARALFADIYHIPFLPVFNRPLSRVLRDHTFQRSYQGTLYEAVQALTGSAGILSAQKVDGYEHPLTLLRDVRASGLWNRWALGLPFEYNADIGFKQEVPFPENLIERNTGDESRFRPLRFHKNTRFFFERLHELWGGKHSYEKYETGRGCPVAKKAPGHKETAIDMMAELYLRYVEKFLAR